jgi:hypothetical protein
MQKLADKNNVITRMFSRHRLRPSLTKLPSFDESFDVSRYYADAGSPTRVSYAEGGGERRGAVRSPL